MAAHPAVLGLQGPRKAGAAPEAGAIAAIAPGARRSQPARNLGWPEDFQAGGDGSAASAAQGRTDRARGHVETWPLRSQMSARAYTEDQLVEQPAEHVYESYIGDGKSLYT